MTRIKDYLGNIASGINQARAMADLESANIAKMYAQDDLLKHFSVPRFRAQNIELTIPIALNEVKQSNAVTKDYQPIDNKVFNSVTYQVVKDVFKVSSFDRKSSKIITGNIAQFSSNVEKGIKSGANPDKILKENINKLSKSVIEIVGKQREVINSKRFGREKMDVAFNKMNAMLYNKLNILVKKEEKKEVINQLDIIVEAHKLRELPQSSLIQIKMTLAEEGMEWQTMENENGEIISKLLPE